MNDLAKSCCEFLIRGCMANGGDGSSEFVSPSFEKAARIFEDYLKENKLMDFWQKSGRDDFIQFYHDQEDISFSAAPLGRHMTPSIVDNYGFIADMMGYE